MNITPSSPTLRKANVKVGFEPKVNERKTMIP